MDMFSFSAVIACDSVRSTAHLPLLLFVLLPDADLKLFGRFRGPGIDQFLTKKPDSPDWLLRF